MYIYIYLLQKEKLFSHSRRLYFVVKLESVGLLGDTWWSTLAMIDHILVPINLPLSKEVVLKNAYFFQGGVTRFLLLEK